MTIKITTPLTDEVVMSLSVGDRVLLSGTVYTARDAAHMRLIRLIESGEGLPFDLHGQVIYYVGPTPAKPGEVIGSAGPTTSGRMDNMTPGLLQEGLKGMIGKGLRSDTVKDAMIRNKAVYFAASGGAGALLAASVRSVEIVAFEELGTEAVRKLVVEDMPLIVAVDAKGADLYLSGPKEFKKVL